MLHKIYLVPDEEYHPHTKRGRRLTKKHSHTELIKLRKEHREFELRRNARTKEIADPQNPDIVCLPQGNI